MFFKIIFNFVLISLSLTGVVWTTHLNIETDSDQSKLVGQEPILNDGNNVFNRNLLNVKNVKVSDETQIRYRRDSDNNVLSNGVETMERSARESGQSDSQRLTQNAKLNYTVCDVKFCLGLGSTDNCIESKSCELLLSGGYVNKEEGLTEFELTAIPKDGDHLNKWFSTGFSTDLTMGDDLVTDCYVTSDGKVKVGSSNNVGYKNRQNDEFKASLQSIETSFTNGVVMCKWISHRIRTVDGKQWDLLATKYHILLAMGKLKDDNGVKTYHEARLVSNKEIELSEVGAIVVTDPIYLIKIHGVFMVIAWMGTVSLAIVFARYYKQTWASSTICGVKVWFAFHRGLMFLSVVLMICAQICIFYYVGGYRLGLHQGFGSIAFILALLNPLGALFRPHPDASNRWIFNWMHWAGGNAGHITAIIAIFLSTGLKLADLPKSQVLWTVISFVIFYVIIHCILQFHTFFMQKRTFNPVETHDIALQDMSRGSDDPDMGGDGPGTGFRRFIIGLYCVGLLAFVIAMITLITLPKSSLEKMGMS